MYGRIYSEKKSCDDIMNLSVNVREIVIPWFFSLNAQDENGDHVSNFEESARHLGMAAQMGGDLFGPVSSLLGAVRKAD